jgi:hypothetical protein
MVPALAGKTPRASTEDANAAIASRSLDGRALLVALVAMLSLATTFVAHASATLSKGSAPGSRDHEEPQIAEAGRGQSAAGICTLVDGLPCRTVSVRPREIMLGGDGRTEAIQLRWHDWGSATASAQGIWRSNDAPASAPRKYIRARVTLTATKRVRCGARNVYETLVVHAFGEPVFTQHLMYAHCPSGR